MALIRSNRTVNTKRILRQLVTDLSSDENDLSVRVILRHSHIPRRVHSQDTGRSDT